MSEIMIKKRDYQGALNAQSAKSLSEIIPSFNRILSKIQKEANENGKNADWVNKHPICILFTVQAMYLADGKYDSAFRFCNNKANPR